MGLLLPETGLLFWMLLSFIVVFAVLAKFGFPVITRMVEERREYVEQSCRRPKRPTTNSHRSKAKAKRCSKAHANSR